MTEIEYLDETWNFFGGCSRIAAGCKNCWAYRLTAGRLKHRPLYEGLTENGDWTGKIRLCTDIGRADLLEKPLHWRKGRRIGVEFMGDLFHKNVPFEFIKRIWDVAVKCPQHTLYILTKRVDRALQFSQYMAGYDHISIAEWPRNVWLGISCSTQAEADMNIPILLDIPAAVRYVSFEPLFVTINDAGQVEKRRKRGVLGTWWWHDIDWVIVGGESGSGARPMHPDWVRNIRDQCIAAKVPFFFKQWGEYYALFGEGAVGTSARAPKAVYVEPGPVLMYRVGKKKAGRVLDGRTWEQYPK